MHSMPDVKAWVAQHRDVLIGHLAEMVSLPSENKPPNGHEAAMQHYLHKQLGELLFASELYELADVEGLETHPAYWPGRSYENRPNLFAVKSGSGGGLSLLFSVHADVVPGIPGTVQPNAFQPLMQDGRLYGRGSNDMKGGIAAILTAFRYLQEYGIRLRGDLLFESVVDEEMGGANGTLAARIRSCRADAAIIPEPTNMRVCTSHLGGTTWRITCHGKGGMGFGGEETLNPVYAMSHIIQAVERYERHMRRSKSYTNALGEVFSPAVVLSIVHSGNFEPGMADGIPASCLIEVWVECLPGETLEELEREFIGAIKTISKSEPLQPFKTEWERIIRFIPGSEANTPLSGLLSSLSNEEWGLPPGSYRAPFACDAFVFNLYSDTPAVIFGPIGENAHAADEFVDIDSLASLTAVYIEAILAWCGIQS